MYFFSDFSWALVSADAATSSTCRSARSVLISGMPTPSSSSVRSRFMYSIALAANASNWADIPVFASIIRSAMDSGVCSVPCAIGSSPMYTVPPSSRILAPSLSLPKIFSPTPSIRMTSEATRISGPRFGYRPEIDGEALTTAVTPALTSASAVARSMSRWSMTTMSLCPTRPSRASLRRDTRATPVTPGNARDWRDRSFMVRS